MNDDSDMGSTVPRSPSSAHSAMTDAGCACTSAFTSACAEYIAALLTNDGKLGIGPPGWSTRSRVSLLYTPNEDGTISRQNRPCGAARKSDGSSGCLVEKKPAARLGRRSTVSATNGLV